MEQGPIVNKCLSKGHCTLRVELIDTHIKSLEARIDLQRVRQGLDSAIPSASNAIPSQVEILECGIDLQGFPNRLTTIRHDVVAFKVEKDQRSVARQSASEMVSALGTESTPDQIEHFQSRIFG
mmetsp:Transcript_29806/g.50591  ORF Transcript_29806/g.50591 Transcript_29806/m.50591 type:complete len:124 (+) Transcript_29806:551-922(+)